MKKNSGALARRYGTALFEIIIKISEDKSNFEKNVEIVRLISSSSNKKTLQLFLTPSLSQSEKENAFDFFMQSIFQGENIPKEISSFFKLMIENHRILEMKPIVEFFMAKADEYSNLVHATIVAPREVSQEDLQDFNTALSSALNKKVIFKIQKDESLMSGFILQCGNLSIDASFKYRFNAIKSLFLK
jgi:F-type H+-transporting ATPase subunit delta